ncbi:MAG: SRPBCC family protein [Longispora sp.]|nr:SRPBCC family protein [Longispora sp. (in: high G+C Gram-positive bacteria)]
MAGGYWGLVTAAIPIDVGIGRRHRTLGPFAIDIHAPRETVFDILAAPYLGRQTHAMADKIHILERGTDMVLAAHRTPIHGRLTATTVETVRFHRPERVDFRLIRGPVPEVIETFLLEENGPTTRLHYRGRLGTDLAAVGAWWGRLVAHRWEHVVTETFIAVKAQAQRHTRTR